MGNFDDVFQCYLGFDKVTVGAKAVSTLLVIALP
jgi:hypothetical protein